MAIKYQYNFVIFIFHFSCSLPPLWQVFLLQLSSMFTKVLKIMFRGSNKVLSLFFNMELFNI
jgi:hypothetical protein